VHVVIRKRHFVLVADDCEAESFFIERALRNSTQFQVVSSVRNGVEVIAYLSGDGQYADRQLWPFPDVLLMNLKEARLDSFDVVEWLQRGSFTALKVVILASSSLASQIRNVRAVGGDAFQPQNVQHVRLTQLVNDIERLVSSSGPNGEVTLATFQNSLS
jgi:CheY-like chemotaxis protein